MDLESIKQALIEAYWALIRAGVSAHTAAQFVQYEAPFLDFPPNVLSEAIRWFSQEYRHHRLDGGSANGRRVESEIGV